MSKSATTKPAANQGKHDVAVAATSSQSVVYGEPLPPAREMAQYEKIYPCTAERIIRMAEKYRTCGCVGFQLEEYSRGSISFFIFYNYRSTSPVRCMFLP